jgi:hypothetical protein
MLSRLPGVARSADNAIAAAFRSGQKRVVQGGGTATGAVVAPLLSPDGCVGVLAFEFTGGGEQHEVVQAFAMILSAQLSTLFAPVPQSSLTDEEWPQPDHNLVAS